MTERTVTAQSMPPAQLAHQLRDAITRLNRRVRQARPVGDLTVTQLSALTSIRLGGALTPRELADVERVQPPTMTKIVAKLEERGLVQRTPHPTDGRQVILAVTAGGQAVLDQFERVRDEWLARRLTELSDADRETLQHAAEILQQISRA
ncbi:MULTISPECIES: MarR family winged helix-turn-helix transcriptional regulator [Micromonospora]|uniref:MarR family transcriptional regulator n=3 Tax=Micromonospora TaxID=1873 RepID=A0A9X0I6Q5_9ACTN|nr:MULTISPECIES: MarR family transcriptional regulator [Micromonospora]KUJ47906.1 MarR family transcriptional regulator [Micromonospora maris]MBL6276675.1 MarR family transcriptional regulator [Micromonospora fiedleri]PMR58039.1 multiple antibiotic resistance transcriptional regulator MarR [Verrucosispora sp. ts21]RUL91119.1 MarR family transcriptional regulator [Verrucosispora sp. FIM060022]WSK43607.1 MarR family transcriptional regulator [Micromonospora maris]